MKIVLLILVAMLISSYGYGQVLEYPDTLDFGDIEYNGPVIGRTIVFRNNSDTEYILIRMPFVSMVNHNIDIGDWTFFYLEDFAYGWGYSFVNQGDYHIAPNDSLLLNITYHEYAIKKYNIDSLVTADIIFNYLTTDSKDYHYDTIKVKANIESKEQLFFYHYRWGRNLFQYVYPRKDRKYPDSVYTRFTTRRKLYNTSFEFFIDSLDYYSDDCDIINDVTEYLYDKSQFPVPIKADGIAMDFDFNYENIKINQSNICHFNYYCRKADNDSVFVLRDTIRFGYFEFPPCYLKVVYKDTIQTTLMETIPGDSAMFNLDIYSNTYDGYWIDSVTFKGFGDADLSEFSFTCPWEEYPIELIPESGYAMNIIKFKPKTIQNTVVYAVFHVSGKTSFKRYLRIHGIAHDPVSVGHDNFTREVYLSPNPASGEVSISGLKDGDDCFVEIFSYDGRRRLAFDLATTRTLNASRLDSGEYLVFIKSQGRLYQSKLIMLR